MTETAAQNDGPKRRPKAAAEKQSRQNPIHSLPMIERAYCPYGTFRNSEFHKTGELPDKTQLADRFSKCQPRSVRWNGGARSSSVLNLETQKRPITIFQKKLQKGGTWNQTVFKRFINDDEAHPRVGTALGLGLRGCRGGHSTVQIWDSGIDEKSQRRSWGFAGEWLDGEPVGA